MEKMSIMELSKIWLKYKEKKIKKHHCFNIKGLLRST